MEPLATLVYIASDRDDSGRPGTDAHISEWGVIGVFSESDDL